MERIIASGLVALAIAAGVPNHLHGMKKVSLTKGDVYLFPLPEHRRPDPYAPSPIELRNDRNRIGALLERISRGSSKEEVEEILDAKFAYVEKTKLADHYYRTVYEANYGNFFNYQYNYFSDNAAPETSDNKHREIKYDREVVWNYTSGENKDPITCLSLHDIKYYADNYGWDGEELLINDYSHGFVMRKNGMNLLAIARGGLPLDGYSPAERDYINKVYAFQGCVVYLAVQMSA